MLFFVLDRLRERAQSAWRTAVWWKWGGGGAEVYKEEVCVCRRRWQWPSSATLGCSLCNAREFVFKWPTSSAMALLVSWNPHLSSVLSMQPQQEESMLPQLLCGSPPEGLAAILIATEYYQWQRT